MMRHVMNVDAVWSWLMEVGGSLGGPSDRHSFG
jgi:hypothetical protein